MRMRKFALGAALTGLALGAIWASTALAESPGRFAAESYPVTVTGTATYPHTFTFRAERVECYTVRFTGTGSKESSLLTVEAFYGEAASIEEYVECVAHFVNNGEGFVHVEMNGCEFRFNGGEELPEEEGLPVRHRGSFSVISKPGRSCSTEPVSISRPTCSITFGPQEGLSELVFSNEETETTRHIGMFINVSSMTYTQSSGCVGGGSGTFTDGSYFGESDLTGETGKGVQEGIWMR